VPFHRRTLRGPPFGGRKVRHTMNIYEEFRRRILREADSIFASLRAFERLYGRDFQQLATEYFERERLLQAALPELGASFSRAIESFQPAIDRLSQLCDVSQEVMRLADAHYHLSGPLSIHADLERISQASVALGRDWQESIAIYRRFGEESTAAELALKSHYTGIAASALLAHERLLHVRWELLGRATQIDLQEFRSIRDTFSVLVDQYGTLFESFEDRENFIAAFPPIVSAGPPIEILTSARLLDSLSRATPDDGYPELDRDRELDLEAEIEASVEELLASINPDLRTTWLGAKEALKSENHDRARHVVISLRELVTHVLHLLAPTDEVKAWSNDTKHFDRGNPTRAARVLFVCRAVNHGSFAKFIDADVRATIEFIDLFQRGTHQLAVTFSNDQLRALVTRTDSLLRFLLLTSRVRG